MRPARQTTADWLRRDTRPLLTSVVAAFFLLAQTLFAAHAASPVEDLKGHSTVECAVCLAGGAFDNPSDGAPKLTAPATRLGGERTPIPDALLTELTVRAASPRAPPLD